MTPEQIGERLRGAAEKRGLGSPTKLARAIQRLGFDIHVGGVKNHWYGNVIPNGINCIAYSQVLGVSIDWLLTGNESDPPKDWPDLINDLEKIASRHGLTLQRSDEHTATILRLLRTESFRTLDPEKKKIIADLIQQFVIERKESMG